MRKTRKLVGPALLLGAAMALPPATASADVIFNYTGTGTYTDVTLGVPIPGEKFTASFVFDASTNKVTTAYSRR
jgi:hypothetical protein